MFKSTLEGPLTFKVINVIDISKPRDKPIEAIDEPEEEEVARENQLSKNNARMIQLDLRDPAGSTIMAIETERIDILSDVKPSNLIKINGPVMVRCGNLMLEKKHVAGIEACPPGLEDFSQRPVDSSDKPSESPLKRKFEEFDTMESVKKESPIINLSEDWDDDDDEDCIILD